MPLVTRRVRNQSREIVAFSAQPCGESVVQGAERTRTAEQCVTSDSLGISPEFGNRLAALAEDAK